jgi:hypothetical protein
MDELNMDDLKQLSEFYVKRTNDAELKNVEYQLFINRMKIERATFVSRIRSLEVEIERLSEELNTASVSKNIQKTTKAKESK